MKKLTVIPVVCLSMFLFAGTASAVPPHGKSTILHCSCNDEGTDLVYLEINVSSKAIGHDRHEVGTVDSCSDGGNTYNDFVRLGDDCHLGGTPLGDLSPCGDFEAGHICGAPVL